MHVAVINSLAGILECYYTPGYQKFLHWLGVLSRNQTFSAVSATFGNFGRSALGIRNRPAPSFCPPIVTPILMMSLPGPSAGMFDNPGCLYDTLHHVIAIQLLDEW